MNRSTEPQPESDEDRTIRHQREVGRRQSLTLQMAGSIREWMNKRPDKRTTWWLWAVPTLAHARDAMDDLMRVISDSFPDVLACTTVMMSRRVIEVEHPIRPILRIRFDVAGSNRLRGIQFSEPPIIIDEVASL